MHTISTDFPHLHPYSVTEVSAGDDDQDKAGDEAKTDAQASAGIALRWVEEGEITSASTEIIWNEDTSSGASRMNVD